MTPWPEEFFEDYQRYDPNIRKRFKGASVDDIEKYQEITGIEFTQEYIDFLKYFGLEAGGCIELHNASGDLDWLMHHYSTYLK